MWYEAVTTSSEWMSLSRAQAAVSTALPRVVVALRSIVTRVRQRPRIDAGAVRQLGQFRAAADARQQQPVGAAFGQQAQRGLDPIRPAGERHDAVGVRRRLRRTRPPRWTNQAKPAPNASADAKRRRCPVR